jgi:hypothetical protein
MKERGWGRKREENMETQREREVLGRERSSRGVDGERYRRRGGGKREKLERSGWREI